MFKIYMLLVLIGTITALSHLAPEQETPERNA